MPLTTTGATTLADMANFITTKLGQFDPTSVALCKGFLAARYKMVWDSYFWQDAQITSTISISAGSYTFAYGPTMDRVVTIMCGDTGTGTGTPTILNGIFLDPVEETFLIESDPDAFNSSGTPRYYVDSTDAVAGVHTISIYPKPLTGKTLRIFGKRTVPQLANDSDIQRLRNCDNAIIAYAMGDMLERARQYGKAQAKFQEAAALLELAKSVERDQSNQPRKTKNLTVAGNSLSEMTDAVCGMIGQWTPDYQILVRESLRRNYQKLYDSQLWPESVLATNVALSGEQIVLPHYIDRVIGVRSADSINLYPSEIGLWFRLDPTVFEQTGSSVSFSLLTPVGVSVLPSFSEALVFQSTSNDDRGTIFVRGEIGGIEVTEEVSLGPIGPIGAPPRTKFLYDVPITVAKPVTIGDVSVNGGTSTKTLEILPANERERKHQRIWLLPPPTIKSSVSAVSDVVNRCLILGKRKIQPLLTAEDTPIITGAQNVLIAAACSDLFLKLGQPDASQQKAAEAQAAAQTLLNLNRSQNATAPRLIPQVAPWAVFPDSLCCPV